MLKKVIKYTNPFTDQEVTEEHYFHISKADLVEMQMEEHNATYMKDGEELTGMQAKLQKIVDSEDGKAIMAEFKEIIRRSYGKKDGDRFLKSKEIWEEFASTEAYSQLIFEVCTDADAAGEFINGIIPNNMDQIAAEVRAQAEKQAEKEESLKVNTKPAHISPKATMAVEPSEEESSLKVTTKPAEEDPTGLTRNSTPRVLTNTEVAEMDSDELKSGLATGRYKLS